jgi:alkyl hydroperoxide reductase subunit AhpC
LAIPHQTFRRTPPTGPIDFHEWIGSSWVFFFSHPADFTPVCTTEMGRTSQLSEQFAARNVKPIGLSTDTVEEHMTWVLDVNDTQSHHADLPDRGRQGPQGLRTLRHDPSQREHHRRSPFGVHHRSRQKVRLMLTYPMNVGRNFDEILRVIDALQLGDDKPRIATPADWRPGGKVIIPTSITNETPRDIFPAGLG